MQLVPGNEKNSFALLKTNILQSFCYALDHDLCFL